VQQRVANLLDPPRDISRETREFIEEELCTM
jgi:hypothetical protein